MSQVKYKYNDDEDFVTAENYNSFIQRVKDDVEELENSNIIIKSKEGKIIDEHEFNEEIKKGILEVVIEKDEKKKKKDKQKKK